MIDLHGRSALVTGGASGIGAAVCAVLAEQGASVHIADIDVDPASATAGAIRDKGGRAQSVVVDVTDAKACEKAVEDVVDRDGHLDVLVTCAGWTLMHPLVDEDADYWRRVTDVNYLGTVHRADQAPGALADRRTGRDRHPRIRRLVQPPPPALHLRRHPTRRARSRPLPSTPAPTRAIALGSYGGCTGTVGL